MKNPEVMNEPEVYVEPRSVLSRLDYFLIMSGITVLIVTAAILAFIWANPVS